MQSQKTVFKLHLHSDKEKQKAMRIASGFAGIESIDMNMKDQKLTVAGAMDPVKLAEKLRKQFSAEIVSVGPAKEPPKKDESKKGNPDEKKDADKSKPKDPKPDQPILYPFPHGFYRPFPPPYSYFPVYHHPLPPPPMYSCGGYVSIEEDPNGCVIC
ncbi:heavy metal-associated isoprenylated plant protein 39 [Eucalyptus grandis]|uniref:HMA domain-containing protein n=3 Tax=Eucalyptus TaxID=3932 RepID=A0A059DIM0_EUCGR|nr:heavy metal-associated isoprenylated plant protein 39 [Eucalyptus grandis]KAK3447130.1 hypothetical protein EUGRSUZ_A02727 [Eucalyptus grandis]